MLIIDVSQLVYILDDLGYYDAEKSVPANDYLNDQLEIELHDYGDLYCLTLPSINDELLFKIKYSHILQAPL